MKVKEIYEYLNSFAPFDTALDFDNVGLLVGDKEKEVKTVLLTLDCTAKAVERAKMIGAQLIISHHPVIFEPLKAVTSDTVAYKAAAAGISVISTHTNLDFAKDGVTDTLCEVIGLKRVKAVNGELRVGASTVSDIRDFARAAGEKLAVRVRFTDAKRPVKKVAVCSGSGASYLDEAVKLGCDTLFTGDVKYSAFINAQNKEINLIDAGHFETENIILPVIKAKLTKKFKEIKTEIFNCDPVETL